MQVRRKAARRRGVAGRGVARMHFDGYNYPPREGRGFDAEAVAELNFRALEAIGGFVVKAGDILRLYELPLAELAARADRARRERAGDELSLCAIINAKSGLCGEDCKFCAQSARHNASVAQYGLKGEDEIVEWARRARSTGAARFGIVTSGNVLSAAELATVARAVSRIRDEVGIRVCASLGGLDIEQLAMLKEAGLSRYHHNIETSRGYFGRIVTTHTFDDRLRTIEAAAGAGLEVCSGGIIGMGETREDRAEMAVTLAELPVTSVPINVLMPIEGTPLEKAEPLSVVEALKTIAIFRLAMPERTIKLAAGRHTLLGDFQGAAFLGGASGMIVGDYLTQSGRAPEADARLVEEIRQAWKG